MKWFKLSKSSVEVVPVDLMQLFLLDLLEVHHDAIYNRNIFFQERSTHNNFLCLVTIVDSFRWPLHWLNLLSIYHVWELQRNFLQILSKVLRLLNNFLFHLFFILLWIQFLLFFYSWAVPFKISFWENGWLTVFALVLWNAKEVFKADVGRLHNLLYLELIDQLRLSFF